MPPLFYLLAAELVVLMHMLFIVFAVAGSLLALWRARIVMLHLPAVVWGAYIEFSGAICPLTPLENHCRRLAGVEGYSTGFIEHFLLPVIYPAGLTHDIQIVLGLAVILINLVPYAILVHRWRKRAGGGPG
jgi:hypothetical protein